VKVRDATEADAAAACEALRASISELCAADHHNDPEIVRRWLASKTPENLAAWIADPNASMLLAIKDDVVLAVGAVRNDGEITLNYVSPRRDFAAPVLPYSRRSKRGPGNAAIHTANCCRPKPHIGSISIAVIWGPKRRSTSSARALHIQCRSESNVRSQF
jgi:hypothetical protein